MKIGVVTNNTFNKQSAFCDESHGYAYYTVGGIRNGSNAAGSNYGVKFKEKGVCGVYLNMHRGLLAFSYEGKGLGKAYEVS